MPAVKKVVSAIGVGGDASTLQTCCVVEGASVAVCALRQQTTVFFLSSRRNVTETSACQPDRAGALPVPALPP
jgi:hypothetical protein